MVHFVYFSTPLSAGGIAKRITGEIVPATVNKTLRNIRDLSTFLGIGGIWFLWGGTLPFPFPPFPLLLAPSPPSP